MAIKYRPILFYHYDSMSHSFKHVGQLSERLQQQLEEDTMNVWFIVAACLFVIVAIAMMLLIKSAPAPIAKTSIAKPSSISAALKHPKKKKGKRLSKKRSMNGGKEQGSVLPCFVNIVLILFIIVVGSLGFIFMGTLGALVSVFASVFVLFLLAQWRRAKYERRVTNLMPSFIDQVNRRIQVGVSLSRAIEQSAKTTPKPLSTILERVNHRSTTWH